MVWFFLIFLSLYGGMNGYAFWKLQQAFRFRPLPLALLGALFVFMVLAPFLVRVLERWEMQGLSNAFAVAGYSWMALALWFFSAGLIRDLWNLLARLAALGFPGAAGSSIPSRGGTMVILGLVGVLAVWGLIEARFLKVERVIVNTPFMAPGSLPIKVAQISDLHLGSIVGERRLREALALVGDEKPDLLVITGDLLDMTDAHGTAMGSLMAEINPPLGKFAVTGNHEYYSGLEHALSFLESGGFRVLRAERVTVANRLIVAGVDDPAGAQVRGESRTDEEASLPTFARDLPVLFLKHRPHVRKESLGRFDLQLSGHTHKGQIFPFNLLTALEFPRLAGFFELEKGSKLYVSRGTGTWGPPMRVLSPPEVTIIEITAK